MKTLNLLLVFIIYWTKTNRLPVISPAKMVLLEIRKKFAIWVCSHGAVPPSCVQLFATLVSPCKFPHSKGRRTHFIEQKESWENIENSRDNSLAKSFFRKEEEPVFPVEFCFGIPVIEYSPVWSPKSISLRSQLITFFFFNKTKYVFLNDLFEMWPSNKTSPLSPSHCGKSII